MAESKPHDIDQFVAFVMKDRVVFFFQQLLTTSYLSYIKEIYAVTLAHYGSVQDPNFFAVYKYAIDQPKLWSVERKQQEVATLRQANPIIDKLYKYVFLLTTRDFCRIVEFTTEPQAPPMADFVQALYAHLASLEIVRNANILTASVSECLCIFASALHFVFGYYISRLCSVKEIPSRSASPVPVVTDKLLEQKIKFVLQQLQAQNPTTPPVKTNVSQPIQTPVPGSVQPNTQNPVPASMQPTTQPTTTAATNTLVVPGIHNAEPSQEKSEPESKSATSEVVNAPVTQTALAMPLPEGVVVTIGSAPAPKPTKKTRRK